MGIVVDVWCNGCGRGIPASFFCIGYQLTMFVMEKQVNIDGLEKSPIYFVSDTTPCVSSFFQSPSVWAIRLNEFVNIEMQPFI